MTATTPIWGKLADLFSKKLLVQSALVIYSVGTLIMMPYSLASSEVMK